MHSFLFNDSGWSASFIRYRKFGSFKRGLLPAISLFLGLLMVPLITLAELPAGIQVSVEPTQNTFKPSNAITVSVKYTNTSQSDIRFLKWDKGLDGRLGPNIIDLSFEGSPVVYSGIIVKRTPPSAADYITLLAGASRTATVNLDLSYKINLQGQYSITPKEQFAANINGKSANSVFSLLGDRPVFLLKQPAAFTACNASQQSQITSALSAAESISRTARDSLKETPTSLRSSALRYKEWFGNYDVNRWNRIQSNFNNIYNVTANKTVGFDCSCDDGPDPSSTYAYVYANDPYNMNVCGAFWRAPLTGTDSKAGTIVHEISHFTIVAGTDDHVYGQFAARSLAKNNPGQAISNADNHEYFAENTPFIPMPEAVFPDLIVSSSGISDFSPLVRQNLDVSGTVTNQGDGASSATQLRLTLVLEGKDPISYTLPVLPLSASASSNFVYEFAAPEESGEYSVELCITAVTDESNTSNNCSTLSPLLVKKKSIITPILELLFDD